ncbi:hypothetical protein FHK99_09320, partial [Cylindrospermopsis raciborskii CS-506_B]
RITPLTGDRSHLGTFHVRFAVGKRLTVNVFRQRMNQLFQGVEDIWRAIALHSQWAIALHPPWAIALHPRRAIAKHSLWETLLVIILQFLLKGK